MSLQHKLSEKGVLDTRTQYIQAFVAEKREQFISMPRQREGTGLVNLQDSSLEEKEARMQASHSLELVGPIKREFRMAVTLTVTQPQQWRRGLEPASTHRQYKSGTYHWAHLTLGRPLSGAPGRRPP